MAVTMRIRGDKHGPPLVLYSEADREQAWAAAVESARGRTYDPMTGQEILPDPTKGEQERAWAHEAKREHNGAGDKRDPFSDDEHLGFQPV